MMRLNGLILAIVLITTGCSPRATRPGTVDLRTASGEEITRLAREPGAGAILVNVWATWCQPCREEFPDLVRLEREYGRKGLRVILVSGDFSTQEQDVREFLAEHGVDFPTYLKTGKDMEFVNSLDPEWSGPLPATWVYDGTGARRAFWGGKAAYDSLEKTIREVLASSGEGKS
jgi:thiol-disulfide isomerase/thioredoxin